MSTVAAADDQITQEIRTEWQAPYVPKRALRDTQLPKRKQRHWAVDGIITGVALTIFLTQAICAGIYVYPMLSEVIGEAAMLVCAVFGIGFGLIVLMAIKIIRGW